MQFTIKTVSVLRTGRRKAPRTDEVVKAIVADEDKGGKTTNREEMVEARDAQKKKKGDVGNPAPSHVFHLPFRLSIRQVHLVASLATKNTPQTTFIMTRPAGPPSFATKEAPLRIAFLHPDLGIGTCA